MKEFFLNKSINYIKKYNDYSDIKISEIKYGLEAIYLSISKFIIIGFMAVILGIFKEMLLFTIIYNIIRMPSFGLHATKSWICLLSSSILFLSIPFASIHLIIPIYIKTVISIIGILLISKNSPADTYKKPIVSKKRRQIYKFLSVIIAIIFAFLSIFINNNFLSNCFIFSIILQNFLISPYVYKIFGLPYNNYIKFLKEHPNFKE